MSELPTDHCVRCGHKRNDHIFAGCVGGKNEPQACLCIGFAPVLLGADEWGDVRCANCTHSRKSHTIGSNPVAGGEPYVGHCNFARQVAEPSEGEPGAWAHCCCGAFREPPSGREATPEEKVVETWPGFFPCMRCGHFIYEHEKRVGRCRHMHFVNFDQTPGHGEPCTCPAYVEAEPVFSGRDRLRRVLVDNPTGKSWTGWLHRFMPSAHLSGADAAYALVEDATGKVHEVPLYMMRFLPEGK